MTRVQSTVGDDGRSDLCSGHRTRASVEMTGVRAPYDALQRPPTEDTGHLNLVDITTDTFVNNQSY